ncbi:hypothetical protein TRFO_05233 [Tritrichomonas foetus]|uniref:Tetraspanin family protein n=1 Tax=Tritrichomonas foetus TaxID=1144522 RepID=A0A1J4K8P1_9EUKA|nr:hypothetical protein TRFO_05233 [Tritrichomonas foetus]|eukprot:OHT07579.1 hypothetical protein TRFO_05233 [Tritrichomonas foetus]
MFLCGATILIGALSTVTSVLTGGVFFVVFLIGSIILKPEKITGNEKNNLQIFCICLCVACALVFAFMLYASWAKGRPYRIAQIVICFVFFVFYIIVVSFISGPIDIILDMTSNLWHSNSYNGSYRKLESWFTCCGYGETPSRCLADTNATNESTHDYYAVYDCRDSILDKIDENFKFIIPIAVLFMLYVLTTGIFFIILLCLELSDQIEAESDDPFVDSEESFFSSSTFKTDEIRSVGSSPLVPNEIEDGNNPIQGSDSAQMCRPPSGISAASSNSRVIMLGPAVDQTTIIGHQQSNNDLMILGPQGVSSRPESEISTSLSTQRPIMLAPSSSYIMPIDDMDDSVDDITEDDMSPLVDRPPSTPSHDRIIGTP